MDPKGLLLIIDPQYDFLPPTELPDGNISQPTLPVNGALGDMSRIIKLIESKWFEKNINHVVVSQDWHEPNHVANASAWSTINSEPVNLTYKQVYYSKMNRHFTTVDGLIIQYIQKYESDSYKSILGIDPIVEYFLTNEYTSSEKSLTLWPNHCLQKTQGAEIYRPLENAINTAMNDRLKIHEKIPQSSLLKYNVWRKGHVNETEFFSALLPDDKTTLEKKPKLTLEIAKRFQILNRYKNIYVCGEAKTHCVAHTVWDLTHPSNLAFETDDEYLPLFLNADCEVFLLDDMTSSIGGFDNEKNEHYNYLETSVPKFNLPDIRRPVRVGVMGDIEGYLGKIDNFVKECAEQAFKMGEYPLLKWDTTLPRLILHKDCHLVILGDLTDSGEENIFILNLLIHLKEDYGERVHIILGNRDLNKLRLLYELDEDGLKDNKGNKFRFKKWADLWENVADKSSKVEKLKFIFKDTMGAPNLFGNLRKELATGDMISDQTVYNYYVDTFIPNLVKLMSKSKLVDVVGDTIFAHGGIQWYTRTSTRAEPNTPFVNKFNKLNSWALECITSSHIDKIIALVRYAEGGGVIMDANSKYPEYDAVNIYDYLLDRDPKKPAPYDMIDLKDTPSVVQRRWWNDKYELKGIDKTLAKKMHNEGYRRICGGHTPVGQLPVIVQAKVDDSNGDCLELVLCDTTFKGKHETKENKLAYIEIQYTEQEVNLNQHENIKLTNKLVDHVDHFLVKYKSEVFIHGEYTDDNNQNYGIFYNKNGCIKIDERKDMNDNKNLVGETIDGKKLYVNFPPLKENETRTYFDPKYTLV